MRHKLTFIGECQLSWNLISMRAAPWRDLLRRLTPLMTSASLTADSSWVWLNMWNDHHFRVMFVTVGGRTRSSSRFKLILCYRKIQLRIIMPTCVVIMLIENVINLLWIFCELTWKLKRKNFIYLQNWLMCLIAETTIVQERWICAGQSRPTEGYLWPCRGTEVTQWTWWKQPFEIQIIENPRSGSGGCPLLFRDWLNAQVKGHRLREQKVV